MNVRVLFILLLISVVLAFTPRFRRIGLIAGTLLLALLLWVNIREAQLPDEPDPVRATHADTSSVSSAVSSRANIIAVQLVGRGAPWHLTGSVQNVGTTPINWLRLSIERYDCPTVDAPVSDCSLQWQGEHILRATIAAGMTSKFDESFYSHVALPATKGMTRDHIVIVGIG
jgi:hypothetical protein